MLESLRLCCTGSIGIVGIPDLIIALRLAYRTRITCYLTPAARRFITEEAFNALTGSRARTFYEEHDEPELIDVPLLVAPASANTLVAMALGHADHLAAKLSMISRGPVFICPAMNVEMWNKPSTIRAVESLRDFGYTIIGPATGIEIESFTPSTSSLASASMIISALLAELPWTQLGSVP